MKIRKAKSTISDSFILIIGHIRICLDLPYRQTEGIIKATIGKSIPEDKQPAVPALLHDYFIRHLLTFCC